MSCRKRNSLHFMFSIATVFTMISVAQAQTKASCTFHTFTLPSTPKVTVTGVNDFGTVVGIADFGKSASLQFRAFSPLAF